MMEEGNYVVREIDKQPYNNAYLIEKYEQLQQAGRPFVLVQFNIKNFRYYNTKYGSAAGDEILLLVLQKLLEQLEQDEYAAYLFADNFAALLQYDDAHALVYERMMQLVDYLYRIQDERIYRNLNTSIGIYEVQSADISYYDALNLANLSRKQSEGLPRRSFSIELYEPCCRESYMDQIQLEMDTADAYKNFEFIPYLQPKVELKTGRIVGAEALLRWLDQDGNPIPVYRFLPILNQNSYIRLVDLDIIDVACSHLERRIQDGKAVVPISFNASKWYYNDPNFVTDYVKVFDQHQIPKELVEIELMESISFDDTNRMMDVIEGFQQHGIRCSLDDFGSGYSSFSVLLNAQLDTIKMDRQFFVQNLNGDGKLIIKTIIDLIHSLDMKVVAEGVETKEHIDWLKECGCECVQGYYYYKPMPVEEFEALLDEQEQR